MDILTRLPALCQRTASASRYSALILDRHLLSQHSFYLNFDIMPMTVISEAEAQAGLNAMTDALESLLILNDVPKDVRALLGHVGMRRLPNLANYEASEERFREAMGRDLGIEPTDARNRILLSNLIESWKSARNRLKAKDDEDAVARAQGRPAPLDGVEYISMRRVWERSHGEKEDRNFPSKYYINRRLRQLEHGELRAERLTEVSSVAEGGDDDDDRELDLVISGNTFRATRKSVAVPLPKEGDTEMLRHRIRLMAIHWDVAVAQFSDKRAFAGYDRAVWSDHVEFLLGEQIYQYRAGPLRIDWGAFLNYEYEIRKKAIKRVNKGEATLHNALVEARVDYDLKQLHFTLPLSTMNRRDAAPRAETGKRGGNNNSDSRLEQEVKRLRSEIQSLRSSASSSHLPYASPPPAPLALQDHGASSSKGKSKGKKGGNPKVEALKHLKATEKLHSSLPNGGGMICYYYNIGSCLKDKACKFHHVCMRCLREGHSALDSDKCKQIPQPR